MHKQLPLEVGPWAWTHFGARVRRSVKSPVMFYGWNEEWSEGSPVSGADEHQGQFSFTPWARSVYEWTQMLTLFDEFSTEMVHRLFTRYDLMTFCSRRLVSTSAILFIWTQSSEHPRDQPRNSTLNTRIFPHVNTDVTKADAECSHTRSFTQRNPSN